MAANASATEKLEGYLASIYSATSHDARRFHFLTFAREGLSIDLESLEIEHQVYRGRIDALLGNLVFEFKTDLDRELADAEAQLSKYISDLSARYPSAAFTGVATDGIRFRSYLPLPADDSAIALHLIGEFNLSRIESAQDAFLRLDSLFAHLREHKQIPTPQAMVASLGPASPTFRRSHYLLASLFGRVKDDPSVQVRYREWQSYLSIVYGSAQDDEELFIRHTYLATLARLIAYHYLQPIASAHPAVEFAKVINGEYFREQDIFNFIEEDFFTWTLSPQGLNSALDIIQRLANTLQAYDFAHAGQDLLKGLYQELIDPQARHDLGEYYTPDWLAEYILSHELKLQENPSRSLLDPACGSGTFLFIAIRLIRQALEQQGCDASDVLFNILDNVAGIDVHPVAVTVARANYLLALGDLLHGPHPPIILPVYLANAIQLPETTETEGLGDGYPEPIHTVRTAEPNVTFEVPDSVVSDPAQMDWRFHRLSQYLRAGGLRGPREGEAGIQDILTSLYSYLTSPIRAGLRTLPPLSSFAADVMCGTARTLIGLVLKGKDTVWLDILKNVPAPIFLSRRRFDLVVGNPPWLSMRYIQNPHYRSFVRRQILREYQLLPTRDTHLFTHMELAGLFLARSADLYLKDSGAIAFVMPRAVMTASQHARFNSFFFKGGSLVLHLDRILDLDQVSPIFNVPACVLVATKGRQASFPVPGLVFQGDLPTRNAPLAEALPYLHVQETSFEFVQGRLLPKGTVAPPAGRSYYYDKFYQGATLVPRNMWFVQLRSGPLGFNPASPPLETDAEAARQAKRPWHTVHISGNVEAQFIYATLPSGGLVPFGYTRLRPVVLPLLRQDSKLSLVTWQRAQEMGYFGLAQWLRRAEDEWAARASRDATDQLRMRSVLDRLDYHRLLTRQNTAKRYRVFTPRSGTNVICAVLDCDDLAGDVLSSGSIEPTSFVTDFDTYCLETDDLLEAQYLASCLNSPFVDAMIKDSQTRGLWGPRDITKRPLQLPIPQFNPSILSHQQLAAFGQQCHQKVKEMLPDIASRYRSVGRIRTEVRQLLHDELQEIDTLVRHLLSLPA